MVRSFPPFLSERKKRSISGGSFRSDFPQKFPFHFTFNQNFRIVLLNGKHPNFPENLFKNCILNTKVVLFFCSDRNSGNSSLTFAKFSTFQSLICRKQLRIVSAISLDWFPDFGKLLFSDHSKRFILTNSKHP